MILTRIEKENQEFFAYLCPEKLICDDSFIRLGVISDEGSACSVLVFRIDENLTNIKWLYTIPEKRRMGAATLLMDTVYAVIDGMDLDGVVADFGGNDEGLGKFLTDYGFEANRTNGMYRVPLNDIANGPGMESVLDNDHEDGRVVALVSNSLVKNTALFLEEHDLDSDILADISQQYSFVRTDDDDRVLGCILTNEDDDGNLKIDHLMPEEDKEVINSLIRTFVLSVAKSRQTDIYLSFSGQNDDLVSFIRQVTENDLTEYQKSIKIHMIKSDIG